MCVILAIYGTLFHVCHSPLFVVVTHLYVCHSPLFVDVTHFYVCHSICSNILWLYIQNNCKSIYILSQNVTVNIKSCCQLFVMKRETRIVLENTHEIIDGKNFTGLYIWDYGWEEQFCSIHMGLWMGKVELVNKQGSMYGKNVTDQCTWDYGWKEQY